MDILPQALSDPAPLRASSRRHDSTQSIVPIRDSDYNAKFKLISFRHIMSTNLQKLAQFFRSKELTTLIVGILLGFVLCYMLSASWNGGLALNLRMTNGQRNVAPDGLHIPIPMDPFPEAAWRTPNTVSVRTVAR